MSSARKRSSRRAILCLVGAFALPSALPAWADTAPKRCDTLPAPVSAMRERILATAKTGNLEKLARLADPKQFWTTLEDGTGPRSYWEQLRADGTSAPSIIATLLAMDCAVASAEGKLLYTWPVAVDLPYGKLTAPERKTLAKLHGGDLESAYVEGTEVGYYAGWQIEITEDGRWIALTAGD